jgi:hypothetical protein
MNWKNYLISLALSQIDAFAQMFANQDADNLGTDDRIARILQDASIEIKQYMAELNAKPKKV